MVCFTGRVSNLCYYIRRPIWFVLQTECLIDVFILGDPYGLFYRQTV